MTTVLERTALRRGTAAQWTLFNPVLDAGEEGYETDTGLRKIGDGATHWVDLRYASQFRRTAVKVAAYTAAPGDLIPVDTATPNANITITLPTAPANGTTICVKHVAVGAGKTVTVARGGTDVFNVAGGPTSVTLTVLNQAVTVEYDSGTWTVVGDDLPLSGLAAKYVAAFTPEAQGAKGDGVTDDTAAIQAAIQAAYDAGGGLIYFSAKTYRVNGQLTFPNAGGGSVKNTPPILMVGAGSLTNGQWGQPPNGGTILDMRAATGPAKIDTRGNGTLTIRDITFSSGLAGDTNPFIQTTNTTLKIKSCAFVGDATVSGQSCVQDAIVLGGATTNNDMTATAAFQGYGTVIEDCYFSHVRRGVYGRTYANSVWVVRPTFSTTCGATAAAAAIHFVGNSATDQQTEGVVIRDPLVEGTNYGYAVLLEYCRSSFVEAISGWDGSTVSSAVVHFGAGAKYNYASMCKNGMTDGVGGVPFCTEDASIAGTNSWFNFGHQAPNPLSPSQLAQFLTLTKTLQLYGAGEIDFGADGATIPDIHLYRSAAGVLTLVEDFHAQGDEHHFGDPLRPVVIGTLGTADGWVDVPSGRLNLRSEGGAGGQINAQSPLHLMAVTTGAAPAAVNYDQGATVYFTNVKKVGYADPAGGHWVDATGAVIV